MSRLTPLARALRAQQTDAERLLWLHLRDRRLGGHKFRRQYPVAGYIIDFICLEKRLAVEADGSQHGDAADLHRDLALQACGLRVLHYWNHDILTRTDDVLADILRQLQA
ncbi:endonuclease domain-containing protein [Crenobacter caeni]|uniref:Endonuclease domain-containing protein n=1 Tax=Crenobacter caeni TaxID=2705474 RepID=A0A6B2KML8_9NEIS|nr:DUF559 domain-containing protein [Crenobacter caeni]NDV11476.1 endonuclease domain-containing protein [Crenobacter caeni]